jgi:D-erythrulose 1-phosphate 3-epimerase
MSTKRGAPGDGRTLGRVPTDAANRRARSAKRLHVAGFTLGISTCFAVKRWPRPDDWAPIVREVLGLDVVQHSLDLVDLDAPVATRHDQARELRDVCSRFGLRLHSTFTGLAAYSSNLLLHPASDARHRAASWYEEVIDFTAWSSASATRGHVGAFGVADFRDPARRALLLEELRVHLYSLAGHASDAGLEALYIEKLAATREPSTMADINALLSAGDDSHVPRVLCLDVGHQCVVGTSGEDCDPYAWLRRFGSHAPVVQLQQSDAVADHHWPFTPDTNARGRIDAKRVLRALSDSGAGHVVWIFEVIPPFEADDDGVLADLEISVSYWREHLDTIQP